MSQFDLPEQFAGNFFGNRQSSVLRTVYTEMVNAAKLMTYDIRSLLNGGDSRAMHHSGLLIRHLVFGDLYCAVTRRIVRIDFSEVVDECS